MEKLPKEKEYLVLDNLNMVHYVLQRQLHVYVTNPDYEDYYQEGVIGLIMSAIRYDESRGFQFSTFAFPNIYGRIQRYRRDFEPRIHYSRRLKDVVFQVIRYQAQGYTMSEIEEITGISDKDIKDALNVMTVASIDQQLYLKDDSNAVSVSDTLASPINEYEELLSEQRCFQAMQKVSEGIKSDTQRGIWEEYIYGLFYGEKLSQMYFAGKYGISQAQVSRILNKFKKEFVKQLSHA